MTSALRWRSRDHAIEVRRIALRHDHRFSASGGAADEVRMCGRTSVVSLDDELGEHSDARVGDVLEIEGGLLIRLKAAVKATAGASVTGVGGCDRESANQRGLGALKLAARGLGHSAVETAA